MPAANGRQHLRRLRIAHLSERGDRTGIVVPARENHVCARRRQLRHILEQARIVPLDLSQCADELAREVVEPAIAREAREGLELARVLRQLMGLLVGDHLQPVLDASQIEIGRLELVAHVDLDPAARRKPGEGRERFAHAKVGLAPAGNELLGLREELDLADAAGAELDVVPGDADSRETAERMNLPLHRVDVGDRGKVEVFPPDEGLQLREERLTGLDIAGGGARLDQGRALPVLAEALVVEGRGVGRERDLRRPGIGAEPQVGTKDVAVGRALLDQPHEIAREAHEKILRLDRRLRRRLLGVEKDDEVDVARVVELARSVLPHGEHD